MDRSLELSGGLGVQPAAYLCGLMAGGREGVDRAIQILGDQIARTMRLLGVTSLDELELSHVTQLQRLTPRL